MSMRSLIMQKKLQNWDGKMMNYFVADSYKNAERVGQPFENEKGNLCTKIKYQCPRCSGKGIIVARVENGQLIPIPVDGGVCYQCGGAGFISKIVRLYTEKEYNSMKNNAEKAKARKEQEQKEKMEREFAATKEKWLAEAGFNAQGETYMYFGESYSIKDTLKAAGFIFNPLLKWHTPQIPEGYEDRVIKFAVDELYTFSAWGKGVQNENAEKLIEDRIFQIAPPAHTEWYGQVGDKVDKIKVTLIRKGGFESRFGYTNVLTFVDGEGHSFVWFTSTNPIFEVNSKMYLSGTVKSHDEYKNVKNTVLTRCKLKGVE